MEENIIRAEDWRVVSGIDKDKLDEIGKYNEIAFSNKHDDYTNAGLYKADEDSYHMKGFVGIVRLKNKNGESIKKDGKDVIINVNPRFKIDPLKMLDKVLQSEEFHDYEQTYLGDGCVNEKKEFYHIFSEESLLEVPMSNVDNTGQLLLALSFIKICKNVCQKQLKARMHFQEENLRGHVKGKILLNQHLKKNVAYGREDRMYCRYIQFGIDTMENQILKAALYRAKTIINGKHMSGIEREASFCVNALSGVTLKNISSSDIGKTKVNGFYSYYKPALCLAKLILKSIPIMPLEDRESNRRYIVPYCINMEIVYEYYCREIIKEKIKNGDKIKWKLLPYNTYLKFFPRKTFLMDFCIPDVILVNNEGKIRVFDVKYKNKNLKYLSGARSDTHQLMSYTLLLKAEMCGFIVPENREVNDCLPNIEEIFSEVDDNNRLFQYDKNLLYKNEPEQNGPVYRSICINTDDETDN